MNELDFDELDQAVSAIMDQPAKGKRTPTTGNKKTTSAPVAVSASLPSQASTPFTQAGTFGESGRSTASRLNIPPRRRGVAMDIVQTQHSSNIVAPSSRASRVAAPLTPTKPIVSDMVAPRVAAAPAPQPSEPKEEVIARIPTAPALRPETEVSSSVSARPAEDDVHATSPAVPLRPDTPDSQTGSAPEADLQPSPTPLALSPPELDMPDELPKETQKSFEPDVPAAQTASPFLATKVEKRPLGAFTPPPAAPDLPVSPLSQEVSESGSEPAQPELTPELVAVESTTIPQDQPPAVAPQPHSHYIPEKNTSDTDSMTIPRQYRAQEKISVDDTRPIFDTAHYHPPLIASHVPHTSKLKLWAIILTAAVAVVLAAIVYAVFVAKIDITGLL